ncbi:hypothetical protein TTHERM_00641200 (macronuclear) [Tetrahymena thermophila SB210]|uniref:Cilia- and flagella-associated protein 61 n=1 Tax=Tetrahymena thermophila (strain SB210) TaxID=312017 RepID=CFA61_TETTS|nr:hypothetical protein TTHERM_00641200 [Tetrahymena thermophila SB210]Q23F13.1 RecName: Full=Cilia- and flagella-associated protein 61; Short=CFAP61; AltName: Full=Flagellar-associated protein 61 [Tetrahymena thermophila SB210]EAR95092.1 hypothetical protein TTHERM_00641200 [Tetrahymena thermophila SB210]|eukprot:XP_001015337.1 hypothetical protein TTHERM_00641200 [Tetrahymena thermophila SB210]
MYSNNQLDNPNHSRSQYRNGDQSGIYAGSDEEFQVLVRKSDLDDVDEVLKIIAQHEREANDLLYDYPNLLSLFEKNYLSVTILNQQQQIIGAAVFNDFPQGLTGQIDFQHENFWENWIFDAFNFDESICITPFNTLWMTFFFVAKDQYKFSQEEELIICQKVFQNVYATLPQLEGILFLKRGETMEDNGAQAQISSILENIFIEVPVKDRDIIKRVRGIHLNSEVFYSPKHACQEIIEIRMAREQDHDDLAEIFNRQSEVLTAQFGEFFIADLIATQNLTRRGTRKFLNNGKAIVGQVRDKAVGLMSISTDIDYKFLAQCFELETYDNLFKPDFMEAIQNKRDDIRRENQYREEDQYQEIVKKMNEERMKSHFIGQRMTLQQHCREKEQEIVMKIDEIINNDAIQKNLTKKQVEEFLDEWLRGYELHQPSDLFYQYPHIFPNTQSIILTPRQLLIETLEFFGLPQHYMNGAGHWKDWVQKKMEEKRIAQLKRPQKKVTKRPKRQKEEDKKEDEFKPPSYFDLTPFQSAFKKFLAVNPEGRTIFRQKIEASMKVIKMMFCNENGEMKEERHVDLNDLGNELNKQKMDIAPEVCENLASFLECFGEIKYEEEIIMVNPPKEDTNQNAKIAQTKKMFASEQTESKPIPKLLKKTSFQEFFDAVYKMKEFDIMMNRLDITKSTTLKAEVSQIVKEEAQQEKAKQEKRRIERSPNPYDDYVKNLKDLDSIPEVPIDAQNAIVINLFCIDENFESRSLDFVEYAFSIFGDRDYIILTQPFTVPETTLLQQFIKIPMKKNSTFDHVLYIYHKDCLLSNTLFIRKSKLEDMQYVAPLFSNLINKQQIYDDTLEAITQTASRKVAFSVFCDQSLIGIYVVSKNVNLDYYISHFCVQDHIILKEHPMTCHTKLIHTALNPLFTKNTRFILKEILRLMNKTCMYFEVQEKTLLPDVFNELVFVRARQFPHFLKRKWDFEHDKEHFERAGDLTEVQDGKRDAFDQEQAPFSLSVITKKMMSSVKVNNNTRIVVVGASDTGISFIESLLSVKDINFTHITLLAPGGIMTMHINLPGDQLKALSTNYTLEELKNLMLDARVNVLDAKMVELDKKGKKIKLDKNAELPYDYLVNTVGLIDTELQNRRLISTGLFSSPYYQQLLDKYGRDRAQIEEGAPPIFGQHPVYGNYVQGVYSIDDPYLYEEFKKTGKKDSNIDLLTRKKRPQSITIYGRTLHTIAFISGMVNRGVHPNRIHYVIPPKVFETQVQFKNNTERLIYEDKRINDPDPFDDPSVEQKIFEFMESKGIQVHKGYNLHQIDVDEETRICQGVVFRKKADNYEEIIQQIEIKKQQILERDANSENADKGFDDTQSRDGDEENQPITLEQEIEELERNKFDDIEITSRFLVTSGLVDIDKEIFYIIHENGLVYNGRLIVKSNFQTTEKDIFCCGKICEFSQRYKRLSIGRSLRLDKYNGRELGQKLAKCLLDSLDLGYLTDQIYSLGELPNLYMPIGIGAFLPGDLFYYHIKKNDYARPSKTMEAEDNRQDIVSDNIDQKQQIGHYIKFKFDNNGIIDQVTYLGTEPVSVQSLVSFVGLSEKCLNQLDVRFKNGLIPNISEFLSENWAIGLYHEWFSEFRHITKMEMLQSENIQQILDEAAKYAQGGGFLDPEFIEKIKAKISPEIISQIQQGTLDFIRENQNHLPMYYVPPKKVNVD